MKANWKVALLIGIAAAAVLVAFLLPPVLQDTKYHDFADNRTILGIPNFWNVISNAPFLLVGLWGLWRMGRFVENWERNAHIVVLAALALVAFGSSYYHLHPSDATLFWDRLPMALAFMTLLAITVGERVSSRAGRLLLLPLLAAGAGSLLLWRSTGDLRAYGLVQFYPMLALPLMLILFPPRYTGTAGIWAMIVFYVLAKALEWMDHGIWSAAAPLSGHPWKHVSGAIAMLCYVQTVHRRELASSDQPASAIKTAVCSSTTGSISRFTG